MGVIAISILVVSSIVLIILLTSKWKVNAFIALFVVSLFLAVSVLPVKDVVNLMKEGFGATMASAGFLIVLGAIIAIILDETGAAIVLARYILSKTGEKKAAVALGITGFVTGTTIFCDSGFIILSGLAKSFSAKSQKNMPLIAGVLAASLYVVHNLIPTHPGALAAAGILGANIGNLVVAGMFLALPGFVASFYWITRMTQGQNYLPAVEDADRPPEDHNRHPGVIASVLPVAVPLILITTGSVLHLVTGAQNNRMINIFEFLGQPVIALATGVLFGLTLLHKKKMAELNSVFETAIEKAGPILVITAAGGMFGMIIKETGIGSTAGLALSKTGLGLLIPFGIAVILKTAQGSSTVAIITAASIVAPMLPPLGLASENGKLFVLLAMGAGSMIVSHANDSFFWVICKFSEIPPSVNLRVFTTATAVMGITVFVIVWLTPLWLL